MKVIVEIPDHIINRIDKQYSMIKKVENLNISISTYTERTIISALRKYIEKYF